MRLYHLETPMVDMMVGLCRLRSIFFLMIRRPPRSTQSRSSAASDVYKRQWKNIIYYSYVSISTYVIYNCCKTTICLSISYTIPVSYTHLRAHETVLDLVCRLLLEKKNNKTTAHDTPPPHRLTTRTPNHPNTTTETHTYPID